MGASRFIAPCLAAAALALGIAVLLRVVRNPETDDAIVMADMIDVVPQVSGTISELHVADNQAVAEGDLLFVVDPRPYEFAVQRARAEVARIDGEIDVTERRIEGQEFAVAAAQAAVRRAEAQLRNSSDSLERIEPLLPKEFVTPDRVDQARTAKLTAKAGVDEARKKLDQAESDVGNLLALRAERDAAVAARGKAELDLSFCTVRAPFDARVVNLHTAIGQFVAPGPSPVFSLVDARAWYVVANYRETQLARIAPGMEAEAYLLTNPGHRFHGTVQGIGWAVNPQDQPISPGLPRVGRELHWVQIAQRFPVRIRIDDPRPVELFRVGASAVAIIHP
ncbi:MAG TPA: HlyD family efflux transporter periplasmic adaptor subunit [Myxococcota bacterium]|nr:HlyD family efflux transporter periplasmic adaptor subunit [Myxococcota bacterium]